MPKDNSEWLNLEAFFKWEEPSPIGEERYESPSKEIRFQTRGYVVKAKDAEKLLEWAQKQEFFDDWMPHSSGDSQIFLREFFWAPAFQYYDIPYYHRNGWTDRGFGKGRCIPAKVLCAVDQYYRERQSYDCSIDDTIRFYMPCRWLVEKMRLSMQRDGLFCDRHGKLVAFDPSIVEPGPSCLLAHKARLGAFLHDTKHTIFWTFIGVKDIYHDLKSHDPSKRYGRLIMNGGYVLREDNIVGSYSVKFQEP